MAATGVAQAVAQVAVAAHVHTVAQAVVPARVLVAAKDLVCNPAAVHVQVDAVAIAIKA